MSETATTVRTKRVLALGSTTLKGKERKEIQTALIFKGYEDNDPEDIWAYTPQIHQLAGVYGKVFRVGKDAILIPDGDRDYFLFSISKLQNLLKEAKKLAIVNKVTV